MVVCILKMLWVSLTQCFDSLWTWGIFAIPLLLVLFGLLVVGLNGVSSYRKVGSIHAKAGWILIALCLVAYIGVATMSGVQRRPFKDRAIRWVVDRSPGVENRRFEMLTASNATLRKIAEGINSNWIDDWLKQLDSQINEDGEDETKDAYKEAMASYMSTIKGVSQGVTELVKQGRYLEALGMLKVQDAARGFILSLLDGDLNVSAKKAFRHWFKALEDVADRRNIEELRFATADINEADAREIAYRSGYTNRVAAIKFFVRFQQWFRGLLWCIAGVIFGFVLVSRGNAIVRRASEFKRQNEIVVVS